MDSNNSNYSERTTTPLPYDITAGGNAPLSRSIPICIAFVIGTLWHSYIIWSIYRQLPKKKLYHYLIMLLSVNDIAQLTSILVNILVISFKILFSNIEKRGVEKMSRTRASKFYLEPSRTVRPTLCLEFESASTVSNWIILKRNVFSVIFFWYVC